MSNPPKLMTTDEVSDLLGVPHRTLDQWAYQRTGPAFIKVGRHRRYSPAAVAAYLEEHTVRPGAA